MLAGLRTGTCSEVRLGSSGATACAGGSVPGAANPGSADCGEDRAPVIVMLAEGGDVATMRDTVLSDVFGPDGYAAGRNVAACPDRPVLGDTFPVSGGFSIRLTEAERAQRQAHRLVEAVTADEPAAPHSP